MDFITDEILTQAIERQPLNDVFDSHDIYFALMTCWSEEYVRELYACLEFEPDPFVKLHTDIAKRMDSSHLNSIVRKHGGKRRTLNCRGKKDECQVWERIG